MTTAARIVVDASVAVKWYVPEPGDSEASALLGGSGERLAPDLLAAELANTVWKKVRRGELDATEAGEIVDAFVSACPVALIPAGPYLRAAFDIAARYQRTVYDALYLALALAEDCILVTADSRLAAGLRGTELEKTVRLISAKSPQVPLG